MRKLNTEDLFKVATIFGKIGSDIKIEGAMSPQAMGFSFFTTALSYAEGELKSLLANISEMTVEEFNKMPFDYPLELIENLMNTEDMTRFLQRAKNLASKMQSPNS